MTKQNTSTPERSDKLCIECGQPLLKMPWSKNGDVKILICTNIACHRDHQPQGTEVPTTDFWEMGEIGTI